MNKTKTLKIGITTPEEYEKRMMAVARGELKRAPGDPKLWFTSIESAARILSQPNRELLGLIAREKPGSLKELADRSGRAKSNLSRTLKTMERYGLVQLEKRPGGVVTPKVDYADIRLEVAGWAREREMMAKDEGTEVQAHCNKCLGAKAHDLLHMESQCWNEVIDEGHGIEIDWGESWQLIRCRGCKQVHVLRQTWHSEDIDDESGPITRSYYYPPSVYRQKPIWRRQVLPFNVHLREFDSLYDEIYDALSIGAYRLCAMGIRALIEKIMIEQVADCGSFEATIKAFFEKGYVAPFQQDMFRNVLIEAGHAAMHRGFKPDEPTITTLLDIVENIMSTIYYQPMVSDQVKRNIPARKPRKDEG